MLLSEARDILLEERHKMILEKNWSFLGDALSYGAEALKAQEERDQGCEEYQRIGYLQGIKAGYLQGIKRSQDFMIQISIRTSKFKKTDKVGILEWFISSNELMKIYEEICGRKLGGDK